MKKICLFIFSIVCLLVFALSQSTPAMEKWAQIRVKKMHMPHTRARYGDLYSGCFLPQYIDTTRGKPLTEYKKENRNIDLYLLHDSYLADMVKRENFSGINSLITSDFRGTGRQINLDRTKNNILIIECSERSIDWRLYDTNFVYSMLYSGDQSRYKKKSTKEQEQDLLAFLFNPKIDRNIEFNLFDYEIFKPFKELKAVVNYKLFDKIPKDITISSDKKYLFLTETVDPKDPQSAFTVLNETIIYNTVLKMNAISKHYNKMGFNDVFFSIIPNPSEILDRNRFWNGSYYTYPYNYKIDRIQSHRLFKAKHIDVYNVLYTSKKQVFRKDDSHWNRYGLQLWVNEVNRELLSY